MVVFSVLLVSVPIHSAHKATQSSMLTLSKMICVNKIFRVRGANKPPWMFGSVFPNSRLVLVRARARLGVQRVGGTERSLAELYV
ncbi:hypothetical protein E2C01_036958 [Portunus trituberculatus]|uniref:Secreted protein n=1 Tax=Portunus trituberculatus TaxID=210409 RepID=A0A5B7FFS2_PORTR|nr:hypothetical protein [Portunus trituberculatus]